MKKIKKMIGAASLVVLVGSTTAFAASKGTFSFDFQTNVQGSTKFSLAAKNTTCDAYGTTYRRSGEPISRNFRYSMELEQTKIFGKTYKGDKELRANGCYYTIGFGKITSNTYNVNVGSPDSSEMHSYSAAICGEGELSQ